jgi:hypothetical protein
MRAAIMKDRYFYVGTGIYITAYPFPLVLWQDWEMKWFGGSCVGHFITDDYGTLVRVD